MQTKYLPASPWWLAKRLEGDVLNPQGAWTDLLLLLHGLGSPTALSWDRNVIVPQPQKSKRKWVMGGMILETHPFPSALRVVVFPLTPSSWDPIYSHHDIKWNSFHLCPLLFICLCSFLFFIILRVQGSVAFGPCTYNVVSDCEVTRHIGHKLLTVSSARWRQRVAVRRRDHLILKSSTTKAVNTLMYSHQLQIRWGLTRSLKTDATHLTWNPWFKLSIKRGSEKNTHTQRW